MIYGHGGDIYGQPVRLDFSISVNPMGLPEAARERAVSALKRAAAYPDPACRQLRRSLAGRYGLPDQWFVCGAGAADLIYGLVRALRPDRACVLAPGFSEYEKALRETGCAVERVFLKEEEGFALDAEAFFERAAGARLVFICNPENPTGRLEELDVLVQRLLARGVFVAVDECFLELSDGAGRASLRHLLAEGSRLILLDGLTKSHAMAGLRLGFAITGHEGVRRTLMDQGQPWKVSVVAQEAGIGALEDGSYLERSRAYILEERTRMEAALAGLGFKVYPSRANFIMFRHGERDVLGSRLKKQGILIRNCGNFSGLDGRYYRIGLRSREEDDLLLKALLKAEDEKGA